MSVAFGGLASGLDTNSIISQLVNIERGGVRRIEARRADAQASLTAFSELGDKLTELRELMKTMQEGNEFGKLSTSSSDESILVASATGDAAQGSYGIEVEQLAKNSKSMSESFTDKDVAGLFGEGTLTISVGGVDVDITVDGDTTLSSLKDAINASGSEVVASVVNDGGGFRLFVAGKSTGTDNAVTFAESGTLSTNLGDPGNVLSVAQNAQIKLDGALTITSQDNILEDVIEGVTLDLGKAEIGSEVTVEIERDSERQVEAFQAFADAYNDVVKFVNKKALPSEVGTRSPLYGDPTLRAVRSQLRGLLQTQVPNGSQFESLAQVGFETKSDGTIKLDTDDLKEALATDFKGVLSIFTTDGTGLGDKFENTLDQFLDLDGLLDGRKDGLNRRMKDLNRQIDTQNSRVAKFEARLQKQFLAMEQAIQSLNTQSSYLGNQLGIY